MSVVCHTVESMFAISIIALVVAVVSTAAAVLAGRHARRSADAAERSVAEAKRSADAAEHAATASAITAETDKRADHRARQTRLTVTVDQKVAYDGVDAIFRVLNDGPTDLDSVMVHRPIVEEGIVHAIARTGCDYADEAELGPLRVTEHGRFTLSLGARETLPEFRVRVVCQAGDETWPLTFLLEDPRDKKPVKPVIAFALDKESSIREMGF